MHRAGDIEGALTIYRRILKRQTPRTDVAELAGIALFQLDRPGAAADYFRKVVELRPDYADAHFNLGTALKAKKDFTGAVAALRAALALDPGRADAWNNLGLSLQETVDFQGSIDAFQHALALEPGNPDFLENAASVFDAINDQETARHLYQHALECGGDQARLMVCIAITHIAAGELDQALAVIQRARTAAPGDPLVIGWAAYLEERRNNENESQRLVETGLAIAPNDSLLNSIQACLDVRRKDYAAALDHLAIALKSAVSQRHSGLEAIARFELARTLDIQGRYADAFTQIERANKAVARYADVDIAAYRRVINDYRRAFGGRAPPPAPSVVGADGDGRQSSPIFLVGFPRSGTTLVGAMLGAHPRVTTLDERLMLSDVEQEIRGFHAAFADGLAAVGAVDRERLQGIYFAHARRFGWQADPDQVLLDKNPLYMVKAGLIERLFPGSSLVYVARHPLDVCFSCFMQNFKPSSALAHFRSLETTADLYEEVMEIWLDFKEQTRIPIHEIRYESLVGDPGGTIRDLVSRIGLEWSDDIASYHETSNVGFDILTPSYREVSEPVYKRARGRWRNYANWLSPLRERLAPISRRLGYDLTAD